MLCIVPNKSFDDIHNNEKDVNVILLLNPHNMVAFDHCGKFPWSGILVHYMFLYLGDL